MRKILIFFLLIAVLFVTHTKILHAIGSFLIVEDIPLRADAAVVLNGGVDIYPRLIQAAELYKNKKTERIIINGNRKTDILRDLETNGYKPPCRWHAEAISILTYLGVPKEHIVAINAEDAFDTITEATIVGETLINKGLKDVIITTSKFHSSRAHYIWTKMYSKRLKVFIAPAKKDPFNPENWWKKGRQIRWVLSEYGAWLYYFTMKIFN